jgi:hypothetical protein
LPAIRAMRWVAVAFFGVLLLVTANPITKFILRIMWDSLFSNGP